MHSGAVVGKPSLRLLSLADYACVFCGIGTGYTPLSAGPAWVRFLFHAVGLAFLRAFPLLVLVGGWCEVEVVDEEAFLKFQVPSDINCPLL